MTDLRRLPHTSDGKLIHLVNLFPGNVNLNYAGYGDDVTAGTRHDGAALTESMSASGDDVTEFQFMEWLYLAGGMVVVKDGAVGDHISYKIYAPATAGTSNAGAGAYDKVEIIPSSGLHIYVPNADTTGDWDLDLTETFNGNVGFTKVVPVPNEANKGYFDWDAAEVVALNAQGEGRFDLFDFDVDLTEFVSKVSLLSGNPPRELSFTVPAIKPKRILPHWKHKVTVHHAGGGNSLDVAWYLYTGRLKTT